MKIQLLNLPRPVVHTGLLACALFLGAGRESIAQTVTLNFDTVNASGGPVDPTAYLASYGITLSDVSPSNPEIYSDQDFYNSTTVQASSGTNFLEQQSAVNGGTFILNFSSPVDNLSFTRIESLVTNVVGTWSATAYDGATELSSVGESDGVGGLTPITYDLTGSNITSLVIYGNGDGNAGISSVMMDDLTFTAVPEPSTYAAIVGLAALGFAAVRGRRPTFGSAA